MIINKKIKIAAQASAHYQNVSLEMDIDDIEGKDPIELVLKFHKELYLKFKENVEKYYVDTKAQQNKNTQYNNVNVGQTQQQGNEDLATEPQKKFATVLKIPFNNNTTKSELHSLIQLKQQNKGNQNYGK